MGSIARRGAHLWREVRRRQRPFEGTAVSSGKAVNDAGDRLERAPMRRSLILTCPAAVPGMRWVSVTVPGA
jgi:hypothetical protein